MVRVSKIANSWNTASKRNVPRYLYHLTTKKNYQQILKDGYIKGKHDVNMTTGVDCGEKLLTFAKALIMQASKDGSNIVVLKIPTKTLNLNKLKCRSQISENNIHIMNGDFAANQKHYTRRKEPIEYICETDIPITNATKIGEASTDFNLEKALENEPMNYIDKIDEKKILQKLFKNTPEEKCINIATK